ncbi:MAG: hypothetical protein AB1505_05830 [Candidatus Latescibacterota bacterium]
MARKRLAPADVVSLRQVSDPQPGHGGQATRLTRVDELERTLGWLERHVLGQGAQAGVA